MKKFLQITATLMMFSLIVIFSGILTSAGIKDHKYEHGRDGTYGYGAMSSTKVERSMKIVIHVSFSDGNDSYSRTGASGNSSYCYVKTYDLNGHKGSHICDYYVNGAHAHTSTAPWTFDFT